MGLNIDRLLNGLKRKVFVSEADFQLELAWHIKEEYPEALVRLEYCPSFNVNMHIDILVILNGKWIPIELKYKTKASEIKVDDEVYRLKNHSAKDIGCYSYLKDIERIESVKDNIGCFEEGYAIFLTNDCSYKKEARKDANYKAFSIHDDAKINGEMDWGENTGAGTKGKDCKEPINVKGTYIISWKEYNKIDTDNEFIIQICKVTKE